MLQQMQQIKKGLLHPSSPTALGLQQMQQMQQDFVGSPNACACACVCGREKWSLPIGENLLHLLHSLTKPLGSRAEGCNKSATSAVGFVASVAGARRSA